MACSTVLVMVCRQLNEEVMGKMIIGDVEVRKLRHVGDMSFMHIEKSFRVMSGLVWRGIMS